MHGLEHDTVVHICLVQPINGTVWNVAVGKLHYMHWAVHRSEIVGIKTSESKLLLDTLVHEFPEVFVELIYPILKGHDPFWIKLLDKSV